MIKRNLLILERAVDDFKYTPTEEFWAELREDETLISYLNRTRPEQADGRILVFDITDKSTYVVTEDWEKSHNKYFKLVGN